MADKSQPSVSSFFRKATFDEFWSQVLSSNTTPSFFILQITKKKWKKYQKSRKKQTMIHLRDRRKDKDIAKGKHNSKEKIIKAKPDLLGMLNRI